MEQQISIASILREARGRLGMTQAQVASKAGISVKALVELEGGLVTKARAVTLANLSRVLKLPFDLLHRARNAPAGATPSIPGEANSPPPHGTTVSRGALNSGERA